MQKLAAVAVIGVLAGCGGSGGSSPTTPPPTGGGSTTVITISNNAASPRQVTVDLGTRIRWVNNDSRTHEMSSDPHPEHDQCPELNGGALAPGQSRETSNLVTARTCGFHDHLLPNITALTGTITVR